MAHERSPGWSRGKIAFFTAVSLVAPFALAAVLHGAGDRGAGGEPAATAAPAVTTPAATASAPTAPATVPVVAERPAATAASAPPADGRIDGLDAGGWRKALRTSAQAADWPKGMAAIVALLQLEPAALREPELRGAAVAVVSAAELFGPERTAAAWDALSARSEGLDVLYDLIARRGGSKASARAADVLSRPEVRTHASPALAVALDLRAEPCGSKEAHLDRAVEHGDERALVLLMALRAPSCNPQTDGCCLKDNDNVERAVKELAARTRGTTAPPPREATAPVTPVVTARPAAPPGPAPVGQAPPTATAALPPKPPPVKPPGGDVYE